MYHPVITDQYRESRIQILSDQKGGAQIRSDLLPASAVEESSLALLSLTSAEAFA